MKIKILLASVAVAVVAAALVGVAAAEFANQTQTAYTVNGQVEAPCVTVDYSQVPEWFVNTTTGEPYQVQNDAAAGYAYGWNGAGEGAHQNGYCNGFGYGVGEQGQYHYSGMGRNGFGCGW